MTKNYSDKRISERYFLANYYSLKVLKLTKSSWLQGFVQCTLEAYLLQAQQYQQNSNGKHFFPNRVNLFGVALDKPVTRWPS